MKLLPPERRTRIKLYEAMELLRDELAYGPRPAEEIKNMAAEFDISERTLRRARKKLNIVITRDEFQGPSLWALPTDG